MPWHCSGFKTPVYHTSKWRGWSPLGGRCCLVARLKSNPLQDRHYANYWMKTKKFAKASPQICVIVVDLCTHSTKVVGGTGRCKNILGLPVTRKWLEMPLSQFPKLQDWFAKRDWAFKAGYVLVQVISEPEPADLEQGCTWGQMGVMGGFWESWAPSGMLRQWLDAASGLRGHSLAVYHLHR